MPVQIRITKNGFPGLPGKVRGLAGAVVEQSTNRTRDRAKGLVSVDSGETRDNIKSVKLSDGSWAVESSRPSTDSDFNVPMWLEHRVKPYLRPALEEERSTFIGGLTRVLNRLA